MEKYHANFTIDTQALTYLFILSQSSSQLESIIKILSYYYKDKTSLLIEDINFLFGSPSYYSSVKILEAIIHNNEKELLYLFFKLNQF